eukprot:5311441-Alexandrium_andersonii.AAC.1
MLRVAVPCCRSLLGMSYTHLSCCSAFRNARRLVGPLPCCRPVDIPFHSSSWCCWRMPVACALALPRARLPFRILGPLALARFAYCR